MTNPGIPVIAILRTYALYRRDNRVLGFTLSMSLALIGASIVSSHDSKRMGPQTYWFVRKWAITGQETDVNIVYGCHWGLSPDTYVSLSSLGTPSLMKHLRLVESVGPRCCRFRFVRANYSPKQIPQLLGSHSSPST